jgi:hypothetical protein
MWLVLGLLAVWVAGRLFGTRPWALLAAILVLSVAPATIYFSSIVSNDATALFAGGCILVAAALLGKHPSRWSAVTGFAIGFVAAWLKPTNFFAAATVALFLLVRAYQARAWNSYRELLRRWIRGGGALLAGAGFGVVLWLLISNSIATMDARDLPIFYVRRLDGFHLDLFLAQASSLLNAPTGAALPRGSLTHTIQVFTSELIRDLFLVAAMVGIFSARRAWYHVLGIVAVVVLLAGGVVFGISIWVSLNMDPGLVPRYGLSVLPLLAVCLAELAQRGRVVWLVAGVGIFTAVTTLWVLA